MSYRHNFLVFGFSKSVPDIPVFLVLVWGSSQTLFFDFKSVEFFQDECLVF